MNPIPTVLIFNDANGLFQLPIADGVYEGVAIGACVHARVCVLCSLNIYMFIVRR